MKKNNKFVVAVVITAILLSAIAIAQVSGHPITKGSKASCSASNLIVFPMGTAVEIPENATEIAQAVIGTGNNADIAILFTAEASIFTDTKIEGEKDLSTGKAKKVTDNDKATIRIWADVDGIMLASPGEVTLTERDQTLSGVLSYMTWNNDTESWDYENPEWIQLQLNTTAAHGFNFVVENLGNGDHIVTIYAEIYQNDVALDPQHPDKIAAFGRRTLILQEMKMAEIK